MLQGVAAFVGVQHAALAQQGHRAVGQVAHGVQVVDQRAARGFALIAFAVGGARQPAQQQAGGPRRVLADARPGLRGGQLLALAQRVGVDVGQAVQLGQQAVGLFAPAGAAKIGFVMAAMAIGLHKIRQRALKPR